MAVPDAIRLLLLMGELNAFLGYCMLTSISDMQALGEVFQTGRVASTWTDDLAHTLGDNPHPSQIHLGSSDSPTRDVPNIQGYSIFGDKYYIDCSDDDSGRATLICTYDLHSIDPGLDIDPDTVSRPWRR